MSAEGVASVSTRILIWHPSVPEPRLGVVEISTDGRCELRIEPVLARELMDELLSRGSRLELLLQLAAPARPAVEEEGR